MQPQNLVFGRDYPFMSVCFYFVDVLVSVRSGDVFFRNLTKTMGEVFVEGSCFIKT